MANKIQFRRGDKSNLPILDPGEPGFVLDTEEFYIGKGDKNVKILTEQDEYTNIDVENYLSGGSGINFNDGVISNIDRGSTAVTTHMENVNHAGDFIRIFVTDVQPSNPEKTVNIIYNDPPNDNSVKSISTDDTDVYVTFEWDRLDEYRGTPKINETPVINYSTRTSVTYIHEELVNIDGLSEIICEYNGTQYIVDIEFDTPPIIETANFTGGYPGGQTELKQGDEFDFYLESDISFVKLQFDDYGSFQNQIINVGEGNSSTVTGVIADRGDTVQNLGVKVRVQKSSGVWSEWYYTENYGSTDGVDLVKLCNLHPTINIIDILYPAGQEALKNQESADVYHNITNYSSVNYLDIGSQLTILNSNTYEQYKSVSRSSGNYNISTNNLEIKATRDENNSIVSVYTTIKIANQPVILNVNHDSYFRSGGDDGTDPQNHTINITSDQDLLESPTLSTPVGIWQDSSFSGSSTNWSRNLQIHDDIVKGTYAWGDISGRNLANIETIMNSGQQNFTIRGFVSRQITVDPFQNESQFNSEAVNYNNIVFYWDFKPSVQIQRPVGSTDTPDPDSWCLDDLNINPTTVRILDTAAAQSSSKESIITIEETI